jgi:hypothetical protein
MRSGKKIERGSSHPLRNNRYIPRFVPANALTHSPPWVEDREQDFIPVLIPLREEPPCRRNLFPSPFRELKA